MAHYARVIDGLVYDVIKAEADFIASHKDKFVGDWVQTSYNTRGGVHYGEDGNPDGGVALRKNYAGLGFTYDPVRDAFIPPSPYPSWILNEESCTWEAPVAYPSADLMQYSWDESILNWKEM